MDNLRILISSTDLIGVIVCIFVTLLAYSVYSYKKTYSFWSSRGINGPTPLPFFGNSLTYILNSIPDVDIANRKLYGRMYGIYEGKNPMLIISDPEIIERVMVTDHNSFRYHLNLSASDPLIANQILFKKGDELKRVRSVFTSGMTQAKLKSYLTLISTDSLMKYVHSNSNVEINIYNMWSIHMLNIMIQIFMGLDLDLFNHQNDAMIENAKKLFVNFNAFFTFINNNVPMFIANLFHDPAKDAFEYLRTLVVFAMEERKKILKSKSSNERFKIDFLQQVMDSNMTEIEKISNSIVALGAGFETTSFTLSYMLYELGKNKPALRKLQEEIDALYRKIENDTERENGKIIFEDLSSLNFLENCFTETLRLHPTDVRTFRQSSEETKIPCTDIFIPANITVNVAAFALHFDEEYFPGAKDFDPDRWSEERKKSIKNCSFVSFGAGPRKCPGGQFAIMNAKVAICEILHHYNVEVSKKSNLKIAPGRLMADPTNIFIQFVPRKN